jgi:hypothetical protein
MVHCARYLQLVVCDLLHGDQMKNFKVRIKRTSFAFIDLWVQAKDKKEAKRKAVLRASSYMFQERSVEYEAEHAEQEKELP